MPLLGIDQTPQDAARAAAVAKKANLIFILSLVSILFCCIGGIAASIVANRARNDAAVGNIESAESQINTAMILMIISFVVGIGGTLTRIAGAL
ncbi:MAG TPA: CD225/dispanin family protein [Pyrinomonadaceae bacterium]|nr:CD225/dispanin family protein [Pyrinomonadaceae bacterium]